MNEQITERVLGAAYEQGKNSFNSGELLTKNPFARESNYKLWEAFCNGFLDSKLENNKLTK